MTQREDREAADLTGATAAGIYSALLGGTHYTPADEAAADELRTVMPTSPDHIARAEHAFLRRAVTYAATHDIAQFVVLGSGIPCEPSVHTTARRHQPDARVVYVDVDPAAVKVAAELLRNDPRIAVIHGDLCWPGEIMTDRRFERLIDWDEPVAITMHSVLHHVEPSENPGLRVKHWQERCAPGSMLILSHGTADLQVEAHIEAVRAVYRRIGVPLFPRSKVEIESWAGHWSIVEPYENAGRHADLLGLFGAEDPEQAVDDTTQWGYGFVAERQPKVSEPVRETFDTGKPTSARMYDVYLGGKDNFEADRAAAAKVMDAIPTIRGTAQANRRCLMRLVERLSTQHGITQFADLGCGLPTQRNTPEVALSINPDARVACVDIDPIVAAHARALLEVPHRVGLVTADFTDPDAVLRNPRLRDLLRMSDPVGILMVAILHFWPNAAEVVQAYVDRMAPGSYLAITHITDEGIEDGAPQLVEEYKKFGVDVCFRSREEIEALATGAGLQILPSWHGGPRRAVTVSEWWPDPDDPDTPEQVAGGSWCLALLAYKPDPEAADPCPT